MSKIKGKQDTGESLNKKPAKSKRKKKRKIAIGELIYGLICIFATASFAFLPLLGLTLSNVLTFTFPNGVWFLLFIFLCSIALGFILFFLRYYVRTIYAKKVYDSANKILHGDYEINLTDELSGEYKKIGEVLTTVATRLKLADKEKNDFINDFSHELKTPIVSIRGFAKLIAKGGLSKEEEKEYLSIIVSESNRLIDLTASTLMLDRLVGTIEIEKRHFSVSEQIRKSILILQNDWEKKNIEFNAEFENFHVYSNEELSSQLFLNVLQNAVKFSHNGGKIDVTVQGNDRFVTVCITDYGIGMTEETKSRMFDKYFRGDKSRSTQGNGLGLATVKRIAEILNLELKVVSEPSKGTSFTIIFRQN
ncbi:MAG: HAMP domain-containing histidine kinase [Clostridia bacterium]|nr:HAMP domain-containing histidine kinase [Clostridia bacterium]